LSIITPIAPTLASGVAMADGERMGSASGVLAAVGVAGIGDGLTVGGKVSSGVSVGGSSVGLGATVAGIGDGTAVGAGAGGEAQPTTMAASATKVTQDRSQPVG
jgi:hypothetical protein